MEIADTAALTPELRAELEDGEADPFDAGRIPPLEWRSKERHVLVRDGGRVVASAGLVVAQVRAGDGDAFAVVGLGGVLVTSSRRGQGLARRVVEAALERATALGPDLAMLFCLEDRAGLYERLGFMYVESPVTVEQPLGAVEMPMLAMWRALRAGATWPPGSVGVLGLPF